MIGALSRSVSRSLRWRFLLLMVLGGMVTAGAASWLSYRAVATISLRVLINDILDLAKVESGEDELRDQDLDVAMIIDSVRVTVAERANRNDVELVLAVARDLPMLRADERKLKQILAHLLFNAIKFTPAAGM